MQFLLPSGLWLLALAIPIILLYMLKLRRKQVQVSSTMLWTRLMRDQQANAPWQKLKRNLLLILQLLILAALVLAYARPAIPAPAVASGAVIVLLDGSASMNATDMSPSRFEAARRAVQTLVDRLPGDSRMTLILVSRTPGALVSAETDKSLLRAALEKAQPAQGSADWAAAFALASGAAHGSRAVTTVIVSDGGLPESGLPALPGEVRYVPVGESADNLSISALALRPSADGPQLFAKVTNYGNADRSVLLSVYFGDSLVTARRLDLAAGSSQSLTLSDLPATPGVYRARLSDPQNGSALDALPLDDSAFAVYQTASARRRRDAADPDRTVRPVSLRRPVARPAAGRQPVLRQPALQPALRCRRDLRRHERCTGARRSAHPLRRLERRAYFAGQNCPNARVG